MSKAEKPIPPHEIRDTNRVTIRKEWLRQGLHIRFRYSGALYCVPHDELVAIARQVTPWLKSYSWRELGGYSTPKPSRRMLARLSEYIVTEA